LSQAQDPQSHHGFSDQLRQVEAYAEKTTIKVAELERLLPGRGFAAAIALLCLPFLQPIPVPGLSVAFGLVIAALGARLIFGNAGALPDFLSRREIDGSTLRKVLAGARRLFHRLDPLFRRRLLTLVEPPVGRLIGVSVILGGIAMALPLPPVVLFSTGLPAFGVLLLCLGLIERDGLVVLVGHLIALATWIYFAFWWEVVRLVALEIWERWF
jgi:hypothetical protein